ncbi:MAG: ParB/RepB/Spo0J family partition protein, partial [Butyrivibrio sp.]
MAVKKGLGKGLGSLIPDSDIKEEPKTKIIKEPAEVMLKINDVEPNREQPRQNFDEDALLELAESIKRYGIIEPLLVKKEENYYKIVAGERRWRAAKLAGLKEVPVVIKD